MILKEIRKELDKHSSKQKAKILQRFFKTGPGEYAEGDVFLGVKVPDTRKIAKKYQDIGFGDIIALLKSSIFILLPSKAIKFKPDLTTSVINLFFKLFNFSLDLKLSGP